MAELPITADDLIAIMSQTPAKDIAGVTRSSAPKDAQTDANRVAIRANTAQLPTDTINPAAREAINQSGAATAALMEETAKAKLRMEELNKLNESAINRIVVGAQNIAADKGIAVEGTLQITERDRQLRDGDFMSVDEIIAETARENRISMTKAEVILDQQRELREAPGIGGMLKRLWVGNDLTDNYNAVAQEYNNRLAMQQSIIASTNELAALAKSRLPTRTPEQEAAELRIVKQSAIAEAAKAEVAAITDQQQFLAKQLELTNSARSAAHGEAALLVNVSLSDFHALVDKLKTAGNMATTVAQLTAVQDAVGGKIEADKRVEAAFNLTSGEGTKFMDRVTRADPEVAAAIMQYSYSGQARDADALRRAYSYMPQTNLSASLRSTLGNIAKVEQQFSKYLTSTGTDPASYKKLDASQQEVIRAKFNARSEGEVPSAQSDSTTAAMARGMEAAVPTGVFTVPAILASDNVTVLKPAKSVTLRPTGVLGTQLAVMDGDGAAAVKLAEQAILADKRPVTEVAKELSNFFSNVLTTEAAFRWQERKQFGLPPAKKFLQTVQTPDGLWGSVPKNLDLADYPTMLIHLTQIRNKNMTAQEFMATEYARNKASTAAAEGAK